MGIPSGFAARTFTNDAEKSLLSANAVATEQTRLFVRQGQGRTCSLSESLEDNVQVSLGVRGCLDRCGVPGEESEARLCLRI